MNTHPTRLSRLVPAAISTGVLALLLVAASRFSEWPVKPPPCMLKSMTGVPCPGCGGTRAFVSLAGGDAVKAFMLNPLAVTALGVVGIWFGFAAISTQLPDSAYEAVRRRLRDFGNAWLILGVVAAVANWVYLIVTLD